MLKVLKVFRKSYSFSRVRGVNALSLSVVLMLSLFSFTITSCDFFAPEIAEDSTNSANSSSSGDITDFVIITNQAELQSVADNLTKNYMLGNDIEVVADNWIPIGTSTSTSFSGQFDGNSKIITIKASDTNTTNQVVWAGLFYSLKASSDDAVVVKNLNLKLDSTIKVTESYSGLLAKSLTRGTVEHVDVYGAGGASTQANILIDTTSSDTEYFGGIFGQIISSNAVLLRHSSSHLSISKSDDAHKANFVGGIVGLVENRNAKMDGLVFRGAIDFPHDTSTSSYVGGLVGKNIGTVLNSKGAGIVSGREKVGGLIGEDSGTLEMSVASGSVTGFSYVGGLVGSAMANESHNVYNKAAVSGNEKTGGLVGSIVSSVIHYAFSIGSVTDADNDISNVSTRGVGRFSGYQENSIASSVYYDNTMASTTNFSSLGLAKSSDELKRLATFVGFDTSSIWVIDEGSYPILYFESPTGLMPTVLKLVRTNITKYMGDEIELEFSKPVAYSSSSFKLNGTNINVADIATSDNTLIRIKTNPEEDLANTFDLSVISSEESTESISESFKFYFYPDGDGDGYYDISTCKGLQGLRNTELLSSSFELVQDIDCSNSNTWNVDAGTNVAAGFIPIGNISAPFEGVLLGNGYTISNLYINRPGTDYVGLFSAMLHSRVESLGIIDAFVNGHDHVGILVAYLEGTINKVYSTGAVEGRNFLGGLVALSLSELNQVYSTASVTSRNGYVLGGLVGSTGYNVYESYATGEVSGEGNFTKSNSGGVVGQFVVYAHLPVAQVVERSYYDSNTTKQTDTGKGDGKSTAEMKTAATFVDWDTNVWNLVDGAYPRFK